jgi:hypothetical protein
MRVQAAGCPVSAPPVARQSVRARCAAPMPTSQTWKPTDPPNATCGSHVLDPPPGPLTIHGFASLYSLR